MNDEKSILLMSEELRAAMGSGVKRLEEDVRPEDDPGKPIVVLGRLIRYAALKSGRSRLTFESSSRLVDMHELKTPFDIHLAGNGVELDVRVQSVRSISVTRGSQTRCTLIVDAQTHK